MRFDFEWGISDSDENNKVVVRERLVGTELINFYGPMQRILADSFIKARRAFVNRTITSRADAIQVFDPRPDLIPLANARKPRHDS